MEKEPENIGADVGKPANRSSGQSPDNADSRSSATTPPDKTTSAKKETKVPAGKQPAKGGGFKRFLLWVFFLAILTVAGYLGWTFYGQDYVNSLADKYLPSRQGSSLEITMPQERTISAIANPAVEEVPALPAAPEQVATTDNAVENEMAVASNWLPAVDDLQEQLAQLSARVSENQIGLTAQQQRLKALAATSREDWLLSEAEYLVRLANQRILTERQTRNALALLESADTILKELDQPDLFAVRAALARDITNLKMVGVLDREGLYLKLDALINAIPSLQLVKNTQDEGAKVTTDNPDTWYQRLAKNAWRALVKMTGIVRVERVDVPLDPVLLPSELEMLHLNVRLALEQAELALMREEQVIYEASLRRARHYIEERFKEAPVAAVFIEDINTLAGEQVSQPLPQVSHTIKALQDYITLWHNRYQPEELVPPEESANEGGALQ